MISVVLVRPIYPSNIGSVSRAMANMGVDRLILVDKQCEINSHARKAAATGQEALRARIEYDSWEDFYQNEGEGLRIALSARTGRMRKIEDLTETLQQLQPTLEDFNHVYFYFGPEDCGLSADDIKLCHHTCFIPTYGENHSLNLSQAVLITLFQMRQAWGGGQERHLNQNGPRVKATYFPDETIRHWLEGLGFEIENRRINVHSVFRKMLLQNNPTPKELNTLETILQQNIRKLKEYEKFVEAYGDPSESTHERP